MKRAGTLVTTVLAALVATGCGGAPEKTGPAGVDGLEIPTPSADPADYVEVIDNPFFPLTPGSTRVYRQTGDRPGTITVTVTDETKVIQGVSTTVVRDVLTDPDGTVVEETDDWYAQDAAGNVWHFGEDTTEYDASGRGDATGSWEAGVDGAEAGIVMLATPRVGDGYQQELSAGVAEDRAEVLALDASADVPFGSFVGLVQTEDTTPLQPDLVERSYYARGVGMVVEEQVGGGESVVLVDHSGG